MISKSIFHFFKKFSYFKTPPTSNILRSPYLYQNYQYDLQLNTQQLYQMYLPLQRVKNYDHYIMNQIEGKRNLQEILSPFCSEKYHDKIVKMLMIILKNEEIDPQFIKNYAEDFGLRPSMSQRFYEEASRFYEGKKQQIEEHVIEQIEKQGTRNKLQILIKAIIQRFGKDPDETEIVEDILNHCSMDKMYIENLLTKANFIKFKRILQKCRSYQAWEDYNGVDIGMTRNQMKKNTLWVLNDDLNLQDSLQQSICQQLLQNPLSTTVSDHVQLTNNQKRLFYESMLYKQKILQRYANTKLFKQSKKHKVRKQISEIVDLIQKKNIRISNEIIDCLTTFQLLNFLQKIPQQHQKSIYEFIKQKKCFYDICLKLNDIKIYQDEEEKEKYITSLSENVKVNLILELRIKFLQVRLPFEQWKQAQIRLFSRNYDRTLQNKQKRDYSYVSQLSLNNSRKFNLLSELFASIEPMFRSIQHPISYRSAIQQKLFDFILCNDAIFQIRLQKIKPLVLQTMQNRHEQFGSYANNLRPQQRMLYDERILKDQDLVRYKLNGGQDADDEKYKRKNEIRNIIYCTNQQREIDWSYKEIEQFIEGVVERKVRSIEFIENYKRQLAEKLQLSGGQGEVIAQQVADNVQEESRSLEEYVSKFNKLSQEIIVPKIKESIEESKFQIVLAEVYGNNIPKIIREIVAYKAYEDEKSEFYTKLPYNNIIKKKIIAQFIGAFSSYLTEQIQQAKNILEKIFELQGNRQNGHQNVNNERNMAELSENFRVESTQFLEEYFRKFEDSRLQVLYKNRYQKNASNLVKDLIDQKAFSDPQSTFVNSLDFNKIIKKQISKELSQNSAFCIQKLQKCKSILADMR